MKDKIRSIITQLIYYVIKYSLIAIFKCFGPPRVLIFSKRLNADILRAFGAKIGTRKVRIHSPLTLHEAENGYSNLTISDGCILNGNNFLDLSAPLTMEEGSSLGPGVIIMTHNSYNHNQFLQSHMPHTVGKKAVVVKKGVGIKANALITMGVTIGEDSVVGGGAVVNRDVEAGTFVAGVPARLIQKIESTV